ncbi:MAG: hypothetical protein JSW39_04080, partial [Desulfobacterales bacterium]
MGKYKAIIPIFLAVVIAGGSSMFLYKWIRSIKPEKVIEESDNIATAPIVVAAYNLQWGTKLGKDMLKTVNYPAT